jgi:hypothetical protein
MKGKELLTSGKDKIYNYYIRMENILRHALISTLSSLVQLVTQSTKLYEE